MNLSWKIIKLLIKKGAHIETHNTSKWTPLAYTVEFGTLEMVEYLVELGANIKHRDAKNISILNWAHDNKDKNVAKYILKKVCSDRYICLLIDAIHKEIDDLSIYEMIIDKIDNINSINSIFNPLIYICNYAKKNKFNEVSWKLIKLLLQKGADIETKNE